MSEETIFMPGATNRDNILKVEGCTPQNIIINREDGQGYTELIIFPAGTSREVAAQVFEDDYYLPRPNSMYDCTGEAFTAIVEIYVHREMTVIVHDVWLDI